MTTLLQQVKDALGQHHKPKRDIEPGITPQLFQEAPNIPEELYHTTLTVVDPHNVHPDPTGAPVRHSTYPLATYATREAADQFASKALRELKYETSDFEVYQDKTTAASPEAEEWAHGGNTIVYAKTAGGQEFYIQVEGRTNKEHIAIATDGSGQIQYPTGCEHLSYVFVTESDYRDESVKTSLEGCFYHRPSAVAAAKDALLGEGRVKKNQLAQYDERKTLDGSEAQDWPFGEDVVVHAVGSKGENFTVAIKTVPGAHRHHAKKTE